MPLFVCSIKSRTVSVVPLEEILKTISPLLCTAAGTACLRRKKIDHINKQTVNRLKELKKRAYLTTITTAGGQPITLVVRSQFEKEVVFLTCRFPVNALRSSYAGQF
jgi:hypothetical protein